MELLTVIYKKKSVKFSRSGDIGEKGKNVSIKTLSYISFCSSQGLKQAFGG